MVRCTLHRHCHHCHCHYCIHLVRCLRSNRQSILYHREKSILQQVLKFVLGVMLVVVVVVMVMVVVVVVSGSFVAGEGK